MQRIVTFQALGLLTLCIGCSTAPPPQTVLMSDRGIEMSAGELRLTVYGYAEEFGRAVRVAADSIAAATDDPRIARAALQWKVDTSANLQLTAFALDPLVSLYDLWALALQMGDYFEDGDGRDSFGEWQPLAIDVPRRLDQRANDLFAGVFVDDEGPTVRQRLVEYARATPIEGPSMLRETAASNFAAELAQTRGSGLSAIGEMNEQVADMSERLKYYVAGMPSRARWEAELLVLDMAEEFDLAGTFENLDALNESAYRISLIADSFPGLLTTQRTAVTDLLSAEMGLAFSEIERQRVETLAALTEERIVLLAALTDERLAVSDEFTALADSILDLAPELTIDAVDYAFDRALVLMAVFLGGALGLLLIYKAIPRRVARTAAPKH